ncbi:hypothetical protein [Actinomadura sp. 9N215]|uniref:nSTAND1 domain-containing NTPase n=1 Tax=Actinomadura sp. 9N215 TaxID=3375150 RepID=UPI0037BB1E65
MFAQAPITQPDQKRPQPLPAMGSEDLAVEEFRSAPPRVPLPGPGRQEGALLAADVIHPPSVVLAEHPAFALAERCGVSVTALKVALAFAQACGADRAEWERRWHAAESAAAAAADVGGTDADAKQPQSPAPYLGLACYESEDADRFFGRDELVSDLVERLDDARVVAVVGPSGSGKSSVPRAG